MLCCNSSVCYYFILQLFCFVNFRTFRYNKNLDSCNLYRLKGSVNSHQQHYYIILRNVTHCILRNVIDFSGLLRTWLKRYGRNTKIKTRKEKRKKEGDWRALLKKWLVSYVFGKNMSMAGRRWVQTIEDFGRR